MSSKKLDRETGLSKCQCMRFRIVVAGKPALHYAKAAGDEYLKRLSRYGGCELTIVKAGDSASTSARLLDASHDCYRIALDERGETPNTRALAVKMESLERHGEVKTVAFLIGAADGHTQELRDACDMVLALSKLTMQHELALIVLLEQIYRLACIKTGSPYHRD
jgi:23S rRNA (pseudouridine1915-N3)-methyltransferase